MTHSYASRLRSVSFATCIAAIVAFAPLTKVAAVQLDYRVPWLRGIQAITLSVIRLSKAVA
jgi:hypothetical protein